MCHCFLKFTTFRKSKVIQPLLNAILIFSVFTFVQALPVHSRPLKKIKVDSSNNHHLNDAFFYLPLPISQKKKETQILREYVLDRVKPRTSTDIDAFADILDWVHSRWEHDGSMSPSGMSSLDMLQSAEQGRSFSCIEYARVYTDILHSLGYICRIIGVTNADIAYGGMGVSHTLCEAWSDELNKWVMIDPQFGYMLQRKGEYINYHELIQSLTNKQISDIEIIMMDGMKKVVKINDKSEQTYIDFIKRYMAYMMFDMKVNAKEVMYVLPFGKQEQFMTSQGGNSKPLIFLHQVNEAYFNVNRTHMLFEFNTPSGDVSSIVATDSVSTQEAFKRAMSEQQAIPDFTVHLTNNAPWFSHYEININGEQTWNKVTGHSFQVKLRDGKNTISVRSVNQAGRTGVITSMHFRYQ